MKTIEKFYSKLNNRLNKLEDDVEGLPTNSLEKEIERLGLTQDLSLDEILMQPFVVKSATNKELYEKLSKKYTKMSYKRYLEFLRNLSKDEIIEYLITNIKYTSYNNFFEKSWMDSFIKYKINRNICPGLISKLIKPLKELEFKLFCDCLLKKKAAEHKITIKSNPVGLVEYMTELKNKGKKVTLVRTMEYLQTAGSYNLESTININTTTLSLAKFLSLDLTFNIQLLQVIYHEFMHAKDENLITNVQPFLTQSLYKMAKTRLILLKAPGVYSTNHDHFEVEISATEKACQELIDDLEKLDIKHKDYYKEKLSEKLAEVTLRRYNELYDLNDDLFDKLLQENPDYIRAIPMLSYEYEKKTGKRKEIPDLIIEKMRFKAGLEKRIKTESAFNMDISYYVNSLTEEEIDKLFNEMIYRKIKSYSLVEFTDLINSYSTSMTTSEIKRVIEEKEEELNSKISSLSIIAYGDFEYRSSLSNKIKELEKLKKYKNIVSKKLNDNVKIKRRD